MADILDLHGQPMQSLPVIEQIEQQPIEYAMKLIESLQAQLTQLQQQPRFPVTNVSIPPDGSGMKVSFILAPGAELSTTIGPDLMHQICKQWAQTMKNIEAMQRTIEHVNRTKLN